MILVLCAVWVWQQLPDGNLKLVFCDVGQGDGAIVSLGYFQALIDTGENEEKILDCLSDQLPFWDRHLEVVFVTHPDSDHAGALDEVKRSYEVGRLISKGGFGDMVRAGDLWFEILSDDMGGAENENAGCESTNECSLVITMRYKKFSALFTGDMGEVQELALVSRGVIKTSDVLKVPHHGSKFSSSKIFLEAVSPKLAVISVGAKNNYGHPTSDTLMRLDGVGAKVLRTDILGTIEVGTDGERVWLKK